MNTASNLIKTVIHHGKMLDKMSDSQQIKQSLTDMRVAHGKLCIMLHDLEKTPDDSDDYYMQVSVLTSMVDNAYRIIRDKEDRVRTLHQKDQLDQGANIGQSDSAMANTETVQTLDEIKEQKSNNIPILIYYAASWCGFCQKFNPTWKQLMSQVDQSRCKLIKINCDSDNHAGVCQRLDIQGFPTIKLYRNKGEEGVEYTGDRSLEDLMRFIGQ